ncbi:cytidylyltransferase domain-containing protein [Effusibacillus lacus]|uniref:Acylneuraminate cytidylyltransferase n=1 Tax=Effusibacillus lacus TaxID=1348429 RepID=A0A292YJ24_9BACL|nr:glycosyltransferase family protein [Effusibacillus lacus]TCS69828.1 spore coat polysaccharide biosynthesis protein SpsF [Effusibacillus lacus]GAX88909.1 acylneuraminate cytidylyltransferase [Effusibacillus lacus]
MKTAIIVQARMTSTRLPGKVLKTVLGKSLLEFQIERLRRVRLADQIIIATTTNETDQPIVDLCKRLQVSYWRGSEDDVLARYYEAAKEFKADLIVRVTSDCPLIDPEVIDRHIRYYQDHQSEFDYVSNVHCRTYPRGMDTEVFSFRVLSEAYENAVDCSEREHVTPYLYRNPEFYRIGDLAYDSDQSHHRWTVDTPEDFELISRILETIYPTNPQFTLRDVLELLELHPEWSAINAHIEQKKA